VEGFADDVCRNGHPPPVSLRLRKSCLGTSQEGAGAKPPRRVAYSANFCNKHLSSAFRGVRHNFYRQAERRNLDLTRYSHGREAVYTALLYAVLRILRRLGDCCFPSRWDHLFVFLQPSAGSGGFLDSWPGRRGRENGTPSRRVFLNTSLGHRAWVSFPRSPNPTPINHGQLKRVRLSCLIPAPSTVLVVVFIGPSSG